MSRILFLPSEKAVEVPVGSTILEAATSAGVQLQSICGGKGTCGKCKVNIVQPDESAEGWVLACQQTVDADLVVMVHEQKNILNRKVMFQDTVSVLVAPSIRKYLVTVPQPSVEDQNSDWERLVSALPEKDIPFSRSVAITLPRDLRKENFCVTAVLDGNRLLAVEPGDTLERSFGLAIDIGTTTVVVYLVDLTKGRIIDHRAATNPQQSFGADVIARITHAAKGPDKLAQLQEKVLAALNTLIERLCRDNGIDQREIYQAVVVGNTTMSHLFLGIDPTYLAPAPFVPVYRKEVEVEARELALDILSTGKVVVLPNVAGYVGSDTVGVMVSTGADRLAGINLLIDIGTNGELILAGKGRILTCSTAAGPAFEGAEIKYGMRAEEGAIEGVRITNDVELTVIGGGKVRGICGSGLIDAVAEMLEAGVLDSSGRIVNSVEKVAKLPPLVRERCRKNDRCSEFVLVWSKDSALGEDIVLTQKDIREMQLAKGAIAAGVYILAQKLGIVPVDINQVMLAGAFGNYIKKESAVRIGLLPALPLEQIATIGNAAGEGAKMALLSVQERERAQDLALCTEHIELSNQKNFQEEFVKALGFEV